jgi:hypothetical protein
LERCIQVKYPEPHIPIGEQTPLRKRLSEDAFEAEVGERDYLLGCLRAHEQGKIGDFGLRLREPVPVNNE